MKNLLKYGLVFVAGVLSTKLMAYAGYQLLLLAAKKCVNDYPEIMPFLVPVCMQTEHPILVTLGKLLNLTY
jgi:hypothetical protein